MDNGMREVISGEEEAGDSGNWGLISSGINSLLDPTQELSFQPGPLHLHTNMNMARRGVPAQPPGGTAIPAFSPNTYVHNSLDSNWE